jgi:hypothetical protein
LIAIVECDGQEQGGGHEGGGGCGCLDHVRDWSRDQHLVRFAQSNGPVQALQFKLVEFLKGVRTADLVLPGRRIDVPIQRLRLIRRKGPSSAVVQ